MASYVGDRAAVNLSEIVVSVRAGEGNGTWHNLHIGLGAIINPQNVTLSDPYDVVRIVRRQQARISSRIVERLTSKGTISATAFPAVRAEVAELARGVFSDAYSKWSRAKDYGVEIVVTSFYLTDLSVGNTTVIRQSWWD